MLGTARPVFGEHEAKLIAHELQIIENLFDRGRSACFVVNEANAFAAVCEYAGFHTVDAPGQSHGQMLVHAFRPPSDQCSHQTDQRVPTDWVQAGHGIVCVEYVTHIESCGKLPFAFGTGQCANAEVAGVLAKIRFRIGVAAHKVIGDVAQGIRRGLVLTGGLIAVPGVGYGIRIRTFALIDALSRAETASMRRSAPAVESKPSAANAWALWERWSSPSSLPCCATAWMRVPKLVATELGRGPANRFSSIQHTGTPIGCRPPMEIR